MDLLINVKRKVNNPFNLRKTKCSFCSLTNLLIILAITQRKVKKSNSEEFVIEKADSIDYMAYNLSFGLQSILKDSDVKTFVLNVETGSLQFIKSDGTLNVRSDDNSLRVVSKLSSNISTPFNFSLMGSDNEDLKFTAKWINKDKKPFRQKMSQPQTFYIFLLKIITNYQKILQQEITLFIKTMRIIMMLLRNI